MSVSDAPYLLAQLDRIGRLATESQRLAAIGELVAWTDPGRGGFYDDLGNLTGQPHLVPGAGPPTDPSYYHTAMVDFAGVSQQSYPPTTPPPALAVLPASWLTFVRTHYGGSVRLFYPTVPGQAYNVTVTYVSDEIASRSAPVSLLANGHIVHTWLDPAPPMQRRTFAVPAAATAQGGLALECRPQPLCAQEKNGCAIAEVMLRAV